MFCIFVTQHNRKIYKKKDSYQLYKNFVFTLFIKCGERYNKEEWIRLVDKVRNEYVLKKTGEDLKMINMIRDRKRNWVSNWLRRNYILMEALVGIMMEGMRKEGGGD